MKRLSRVGMILAVVGVFAIGTALFTANSTVEARPKYLTVFKEKYEKVKEQADTKKCAVCHDGSPKAKKWNAYGKALKKSLGEANIEDDEKIKESLKKIEKEDSAVKGKTFGDLLESGKLPVEVKKGAGGKKRGG